MEPNSQSSSLNTPLTSSAVISSQLEVREVRRIPLLTLNREPMEYSLSQEAQNYLSFLKGKCYVISVSGKPTIGKSSLLNILISLLKRDASQEDVAYQGIYPIGNKATSTTRDVDMYCLTLKERNFIFLDVEGDGDSNRENAGSWIYANLLQTIVGVSHVHLYNYTGLPQENILSDFELIIKAIRQNKVHDHFKTKFLFMVRDHPLKSKNIPAKKFEEFKSPIDKRLSQSGIDYSLCFLPNPPDHITDKDAEASCIASTGFLCQECQSHLFLSILFDITDELNQRLSELPKFQNGNHLHKALEYLIRINRRELPFFSDEGHMSISQRRLCKLRNEGTRIQKELFAVKGYLAQNGFYKEVQRIMSDHENDANHQFSENLKKVIEELGKNVSRIEYMIKRLSEFIHQYLLNGWSSILQESEKKSFVGHLHHSF